MAWERCSDYLCLNVTNITYDLPGILSKREILATTPKTFDPLGVACPAVAFIRVQTRDSVQVHLLQAEARVAPSENYYKRKKKTTIARLELLGATICARLASSVIKEFKADNIYFWTNSSTVLARIQKNEIRDVFVHNRIKEIKQLTSVEAWRHVNPADLPSRGCSASYLIASRWWPEWLYLSPEEWPKTKTAIFQRDDTSEFRTPTILPSDHPRVRSLVMEEHKLGVPHVLNSLRERFCILAGRRVVPSVLKTCITCKRYSSKNVNPPAPPLLGVKVQNGEIIRTVQNFYRLELPSTEELPSKFNQNCRCENISAEQTPFDDAPVKSDGTISADITLPQ
ncbi:hypothetical protein AVEN_178395-1 [Araneus ventricosus]|uniref:Integrase zinc-binding domain-containing protein n=1 Tax=Araneus ventricosus TaxID=182803 RepID=A0A4Y2BCR2_ARAVE|nr:hypothetical protein AVEN_178395-1 [Araneus ventricosus]